MKAKRNGASCRGPRRDGRGKELHHAFERALAETKLPERPGYEAANGFLIKARKEMAK